MAWERIVKRAGVGACPKCLSVGFDYQDKADPRKDENAAIQCPTCGWKGMLRELVVVPN